MSTFGSLNTAYTGLVAARNSIDVVGQNIVNSGSAGYTRQRVITSAVPGVDGGLLGSGFRVGQGVSVDGIARLGDSMLDGRVRFTASAAGHWSVRSTAASAAEATLREPGTQGISRALQEFWSGWQGVANRAGDPAPAGVLLENAATLAGRIAQGYTEVENEWASTRTELSTTVAEVNQAAEQIGLLNEQIRQIRAGGGTANELIDARSTLATKLSGLTGATVRDRGDDMIDVVVDGNSLVAGDVVRRLAAVGSPELAGAGAAPVRVEWADRPGESATIDGGEIAGYLAVLAPAAGGSGGVLAETAAAYDALALDLATRVNALHTTGAAPDGTTGHDFFALTAGLPPARGLTVVPTDVDGIAAGTPGTGGANGGVADAIAQLAGPDGPDGLWSDAVVGIGVVARTAKQQSTLAGQAAAAAVKGQLSQASVDLDEETTSLIAFQHAYQGAARVMTAVDELLDVLINRTGVVGR
ncbi:flagellar hook-associated protein 1 FlgK [Diaminobutyricimonas aerilata]|uniref:Flagellar hook-associated protein 1 n=1 Tax=Diaminobutyricimonas aerilata TaxID=1162967 RepID=A0A2M9CN21_9MICO|nr:flagellar hook-associated protein FlgK [Diaminobutyricimonas aerilata]PJJ73300.1 flagellar hook-associated protein 1 FlgK [Diaminobutyricimonas aerilata]